MVEKRSGDVDVLENQMRNLRFSSVASNNRSRESSPMLMTPQKKKSASSIFSPEPVIGTPRNLNSSIMSLGGRATPTRKKLSGFGEGEKAALRDKRATKRANLGKLKSRVEETGVSVWTMEELE
jgi:nucleoporin NUP159